MLFSIRQIRVDNEATTNFCNCNCLEKEALLFNNKLNKLITLVKKATRDEVIEELVHDIDQELIRKMYGV